MHRVLVVDDENAWRHLLRERLENWGFDVHTAGDVWHAMRRMHRIRFDAVVLDVQMPGNGRTVFEHVRRAMPDLPVVVHTACRELLGRNEFAAAAARLSKSVNMKPLRAALERLLGPVRRRRRRPSDGYAVGACRFD